MTSPLSPLEATFFAALEKDSPAERAAYLDQACGDDPALRKQVERMLAAEAEAGSFLEVAADGIDRAAVLFAAAEGPDSTIGRYKLMEEIAEGGMGVVYRAEQREPVRRTVALKIIKPGMDTREVIARFGSERQALAMMDHPNIAKVFDAGETESGRPYFAMELVDGKPLTEYCDQQRLATAQRLELFIQVCLAVQHAHQKGIIHRDLKPSNVLVALYDGLPVPKIIDFGIAKAVHSQPSAAAITTGLGRMIGTPLYMSPEQAGREGLDVDTRSDVYSLGVMLYELLTGRTPFDQKRAQTADYDEIRRMIREEEPLRPSARISTLGKAATTVSTCRKTEPVKLGRLLRGDLDWIVMRALEKDPARRYQTAADFARDIERHLAHAPVHAGPPGKWYRATKLVRRFRAPLAIAAGFAMLLIVITIGAVRAYYREAKLNSDLEIATRQAESDAKRAKASFEMAREAVKNYYTTVATDPRLKPHDLEKLRRDLLESANEYYEKMTKQDADDPSLQRERVGAFIACGDVESDIGNWSDAEAAYDRAFAAATRLAQVNGPDVENQAELANVQNNLGRCYLYTGRTKEAETAYKQARAIWETLVENHPGAHAYRDGLAASCNELGNVYKAIGGTAEAEAAYKAAAGALKSLAERRPGAADDQLAVADGNLGDLFQIMGRPKEAEAAYDEALAIRKILADQHPDDPEYQNRLATIHGSIGALYSGVGRNHEAETAFEEALAIRKSLADRHPDVPEYQNELSRVFGNLGTLYQATGRTKEAGVAFERALAVRRTLAEMHPDVPEYPEDAAASYDSLGTLYWAAGRTKEAEAAFQRAIAVQKTLTQTHLDVPRYQQSLAESYNKLAAVYAVTGRAKEAESAFKESLVVQKALAERHPELPGYQEASAASRTNLGQFYYGVDRYTEAIAVEREALAICKSLAEDHPETPGYRSSLAAVYHQMGSQFQALGERNEAEAADNEAIALQKTLAEKYPDVPSYRNDLALGYDTLGNLYQDLDRNNEAATAFIEALAIGKTLVRQHPTTRSYLNNLAFSYNSLADVYQDTGRRMEAEANYQQAISIRKTLAEKYPDVPEYQDFLGESYQDVGDLDQATGRAEEAADAYEEAVAVWNVPRKNHLQPPEYRVKLAQAYLALARYYAKLVAGKNRPGVADADQSAASANRLAARSFECMEQLCDLGCFDDPKYLEAMRRDRGLDGLRDRPEYKKLLERIAARTMPTPKSQ